MASDSNSKLKIATLVLGLISFIVYVIVAIPSGYFNMIAGFGLPLVILLCLLLSGAWFIILLILRGQIASDAVTLVDLILHAVLGLPLIIIAFVNLIYFRPLCGGIFSGGDCFRSICGLLCLIIVLSNGIIYWVVAYFAFKRPNGQ